MRAGLYLGLLFVALTGAACASTPDPNSVVDVANDPNWIPPGQGDLAVGDDPGPKAKPKARKPRHLEKPNKSDVPAHGVQAMNP